ncbi:hypothetical protein DDE74_32095 [Streptomyces lydicus]|uniref:Uncharacterized protein n=1 Tax=Streptomyces lydicus TaxID=47763 RepID=A0A3S9YIY5_9ACTN|nr:hypothetical protein DDE74_32095 [Streptomyces lydicus]
MTGVPLGQPLAGVTWAVFSPDGQILATRGEDRLRLELDMPEDSAECSGEVFRVVERGVWHRSSPYE